MPQVLPPEKMLKGEVYRTAEDTMLGALSTALGAVSTLAAALVLLHAPAVPGPPGPYPDTLPLTPVVLGAAALAAAATAAGTAIGTFQAAAATYLARVGRVE